MFCCTLLYVHSSIAIILTGKRELVALLNLSSWCLVMVERLFLAVPWGCLRFVIVVFPDHTHFFFYNACRLSHNIAQCCSHFCRGGGGGRVFDTCFVMLAVRQKFMIFQVNHDISTQSVVRLVFNLCKFQAWCFRLIIA